MFIASLLGLGAYVVAMQLGIFAGDLLNHGRVAGLETQQSLEQRAVLFAKKAPDGPGVAMKESLDLVPQDLLDDGLVLARVRLVAVPHPSDGRLSFMPRPL